MGLRYGAIAQLVERVLCKHEVVGSIPSGSTISSRSRMNQFAAPLGGSAIDIVNEGSLRRAPRVSRMDLRRHHCLTQSACSNICSIMSFAENDQAHKGF